MRCRMNPVADPVNIPAPQIVYLEIYNSDTLDKGTSLWTPATRVIRPKNVSHWSPPDHVFEKKQRL